MDETIHSGENSFPKTGFIVISFIAILCLLYAIYGIFFSSPEIQSTNNTRSIAVTQPTVRTLSRNSTPQPTIQQKKFSEGGTEDDQYHSASTDRGWQLAIEQSKLRQQEREKMFSEAVETSDDRSPNTVDQEILKIEKQKTAYLNEVRVFLLRLKDATDQCRRISEKHLQDAEWSSNVGNHDKMWLEDIHHLRKQKKKIDLSFEKLPEAPKTLIELTSELEQLYDLYSDIFDFSKRRHHHSTGKHRELDEYVTAFYEQFYQISQALNEK